MHHQISKTLLFDELLLSILVANGLGDQCEGVQATIQQIWNDFVPSMHHDFITGTAAAYVYRVDDYLFFTYPLKDEQMPLLYLAQNNSLLVQQKLLGLFASLIDSQSITYPITVFNTLGFERQGIYEVNTENFLHINSLCSEEKICQVTDTGVLMNLELPRYSPYCL